MRTTTRPPGPRRLIRQRPPAAPAPRCIISNWPSRSMPPQPPRMGVRRATTPAMGGSCLLPRHPRLERRRISLRRPIIASPCRVPSPHRRPGPHLRPNCPQQRRPGPLRPRRSSPPSRPATLSRLNRPPLRPNYPPSLLSRRKTSRRFSILWKSRSGYQSCRWHRLRRWRSSGAPHLNRRSGSPPPYRRRCQPHSRSRPDSPPSYRHARSLRSLRRRVQLCPDRPCR
jgi:hypothetical protein